MKSLLVTFSLVSALLISQLATAAPSALSCGNNAKNLSLTAKIAGSGYLTQLRFKTGSNEYFLPSIKADAKYAGAKGDRYVLDDYVIVFLPKQLAPGAKFTGTATIDYKNSTLFCAVK